MMAGFFTFGITCRIYQCLINMRYSRGNVICFVFPALQENEPWENYDWFNLYQWYTAEN